PALRAASTLQLLASPCLAQSPGRCYLCKRDVRRPVTDHCTSFCNDRRYPHCGHVLHVQDSHTAVDREFPQILRTAVDANLNGTFRVQYPVEDRLAEWAAVMKLRSLERAARIAMRVDMNHANRSISTQRFENRVGNRMVATHRKWDH